MLINPKDLQFEFFKTPGPGGQHKNKRRTSVRLRHLPTGIIVVACDERSQARNKTVALARLVQRLRARFRKKKKRIPTKRPRAVKERILAYKKKRSLKKRMRSRRIDIDEG